MTKEQKKQIKDNVWYIKSYLDDLETDINDDNKLADDLQDYLEMAIQRINAIEDIIHQS